MLGVCITERLQHRIRHPCISPSDDYNYITSTEARAQDDTGIGNVTTTTTTTTTEATVMDETSIEGLHKDNLENILHGAIGDPSKILPSSDFEVKPDPNNATRKVNDDGTPYGTTATLPKPMSKKTLARWAILRRAIVSSASNSKSTAAAASEGSIHQFCGFNFLQKKRLKPNDAKLAWMVKAWKELLTDITISQEGITNTALIVDALEASLLALSALRPDQWIWEFSFTTTFDGDAGIEDNQNGKLILDLLEERLLQQQQQPLRLKRDGSGWISATNKGAGAAASGATMSRKMRIVLAPFFPTHCICLYTLPSFSARTEETQDKDGTGSATTKNDDQSLRLLPQDVLFIRERLPPTSASSKSLSLQELTSHHHNEGVDNTGNICVWDSEQTMAFCLLKHLHQNKLFLPNGSDATSGIDILELGSGMAGLAGLALVNKLQQHYQEQPIRLWLTDGHPQAVQNNRVHAYLRHSQQKTNTLSTPSKKPGVGGNSVQCRVLRWALEKPTVDTPPRNCQIAIVSDCTHFQEFHAHLFLTLAYSVQVYGSVYLCQPHRGTSLERFLNVVRSTGIVAGATSAHSTSQAEDDSPLFSIEWLDISIEEVEDAVTAASFLPHYDANIHRPHWILLRKLREITDKDRSLVLEHMECRDKN